MQCKEHNVVVDESSAITVIKSDKLKTGLSLCVDLHLHLANVG